LFVAELNYLVADMSILSISYYQMACIIDDITRESFASWITSLDNQPRGNIEEAQELVGTLRVAARQLGRPLGKSRRVRQTSADAVRRSRCTFQLDACKITA
jgi:hypothetical protein